MTQEMKLDNEREQLAGSLASTRALLLAASERAGLDDNWRVLFRNHATYIEGVLRRIGHWPLGFVY